MMLSRMILFVMSTILVTALPNDMHHGDEMNTTLEKQMMTMAEQKAMIYNTCVNKSGVSSEDIKKLRQMDFKNTNEKAQFYVHCSLKMMELVDKDDMLDYEMIHKMVEKTMPPPAAMQMKKTVEGCKQEDNEEEGCDVAFQFITCVTMKHKEFLMTLFE